MSAQSDIAWYKGLAIKKKSGKKKNGIRALPRIVACSLGKTISNTNTAQNWWMLSLTTRRTRCRCYTRDTWSRIKISMSAQSNIAGYKGFAIKKKKRKKKGIRSLPRIVACYLGKTMSNADAARNEWMLSRYRRCPTEKQKFNHAQIYLRIDTYHAGIADEDSIQSHR